MPTPPTMTFVAGDGTMIDLAGDTYLFVRPDSRWSFPPVELDIVRRTQRGGVTIPYASLGEREFGLSVIIFGATAEDTQANYNALITAMSITLGANEPRFGVLTFDGFGASSTPVAIRCAVKNVTRQRLGLNLGANITFTSEDGIWYSPTRLTIPPQVLSIASDLPVVATSDAEIGDPMPWAIGSGKPHADTSINYDGSAVSRSLIVTVTGPSRNPRVRRGDVELRFNDFVPEGTSFRMVMASGGRHELLDSTNAVIGEFVQAGRSFPVSLAPGGNELTFEQDNEIDGAYNTVAYSYRLEYVSLGV